MCNGTDTTPLANCAREREHTLLRKISLSSLSDSARYHLYSRVFSFSLSCIAATADRPERSAQKVRQRERHCGGGHSIRMLLLLLPPQLLKRRRKKRYNEVFLVYTQAYRRSRLARESLEPWKFSLSTRSHSLAFTRHYYINALSKERERETVAADYAMCAHVFANHYILLCVCVIPISHSPRKFAVYKYIYTRRWTTCFRFVACFFLSSSTASGVQ